MGIGFSAALSKYYSPTTLLHRSVVVIDIVTSQESYRMASDDNIVNKGNWSMARITICGGEKQCIIQFSSYNKQDDPKYV